MWVTKVSENQISHKVLLSQEYRINLLRVGQSFLSENVGKRKSQKASITTLLSQPNLTANTVSIAEQLTIALYTQHSIAA